MEDRQHGKRAERSTMLDAAITLERKGFSVIPIREPYKRVLGSYFAKKNGKFPMSIKGLFCTYLDWKTDVRAFASHQNVNIGVLTGRRHNLVIIDVDFPEGGESSMKKLNLPKTLTALTKNGLHLYYRHPGGKVPTCAGRLAPGIDVKGEHNYVIAPLSLHYSGFRYQWLDEGADISELSAEIVDDLLQLPRRGRLRGFMHVLVLVYLLMPISAVLGILFQSSKHKA